MPFDTERPTALFILLSFIKELTKTLKFQTKNRRLEGGRPDSSQMECK